MSQTKSWAIYNYPDRAEERFVDEARQAVWSGLYDASGNKLYRHPNPIGFETDPSRKFTS